MAKQYQAKIDRGDDATGTHEKSTQSLAWLKDHYTALFPGVVFEKGKGNSYNVILDGESIGSIEPVD